MIYFDFCIFLKTQITQFTTDADIDSI